MYMGIMNPKYLIDWIANMYLEFEHNEDPQRVKFSCMKLKDHKGSRMVVKERGKFQLADFSIITLLRRS